MIEINLSPAAERARSARRPRVRLRLPAAPPLGADPRAVALGAGALLVLLLVGYLFWRQGVRQEALDARIQQEVADSTRFATTIELVRALQVRQDTIRQKIEVIREVDQRRYVWPHLLDEISRSVPAYTWLTEIRSAETPGDTLQAAGPAFSLQGHAGSTQALTRFMKDLEGSSFVRDVTLVTSEQVELEGRTLHRFTLEALYQTPDPSVIQTAPLVTLE